MAVHELFGLQATNPLGFMAALGLLRVIEHNRTGTAERPTLAFASGGECHAKLQASLDAEELTELVLTDAQAQEHCPAMRLAYTKDGNEVAPTDPNAIRDLKPTPQHATRYLRRVAVENRRSADLAAGFFSELVQQSTNADRTKPTAFHFTAGQQTFLSMVEKIRSGLTKDDVVEALYGPWQEASPLPSLRWDASGARMYALRAKNPSSDKGGSVAAANWLAVQGLAFFPVVVQRDRLMTTCVEGSWEDSVFRWPIWEQQVTCPAIAGLLRMNAAGMSPSERKACGVFSVLQAGIVRSDYGSFAPPAPC